MSAEKVGGWTSWITKYICFGFFLIYYLVTLLPSRMWFFCFCILLRILIALLHPLVLFSFSCMYFLPSLFSIIFILAEKYFKSCKFTCVMFLKIKKKMFQIQIKILFIVKIFLYYSSYSSNFDKYLENAGDYELQATYMEALFRLVTIEDKDQLLAKWFTSDQMRNLFCSIRNEEFETVSCKFSDLVIYIRLVCSVSECT